MNFNIQLFADAQTNTTGTMSVEMKTFYEKRLIDQAEPRLVHHHDPGDEDLLREAPHRPGRAPAGA